MSDKPATANTRLVATVYRLMDITMTNNGDGILREVGPLFDEIERLRQRIDDEKGAADAYAMRVTELERELAEARSLLAGLADLCERAGFPCTAARAFLQPDQPDDETHCADCGAELELVRPGKWQHYGGVECTPADKSPEVGK